jgi:HD-GYP domain-containing protein (c-di-GMP phosphodiesterase class II)
MEEVSMDPAAIEAAAATRHCDRCGVGLSYLAPLQPDGRRLCEHCFLQTSMATDPCRNGLISDFADALVDALDLREHETGLHSRRVACHTLVLARHLVADERRLRQIYWGALLHDIGKIGVPDRILLKPGALDPDDWQVMRRHPDDGHRLVSRLAGMEEAADIVRAHEERFDGTGYPRGLRGEAIPLGARIFAVIDTLDAMTSDRPYRKGMPFDAAIEEIMGLAGVQFDPRLIAPLELEADVLRRMVEMKCMLPA